MNIEPTRKDDLAEILTLQKLAYRSEGEIYGDLSIQPLIQTLTQLREEFDSKIILKAVENREIVGSVRGSIQDKIGMIEKLITHPQHQGQGIGTALLDALEDRMMEADKFRLFTGHRSERNLAFYRKRGYVEFKQGPINDKLIFIWLEKDNDRRKF